MFWTKKKPAETPSPSDIVASLVAARMIASPERIRFNADEYAYGTRYRKVSWADDETGIYVEAKTGISDPFQSSMYGSLTAFRHKGIDLAPSSLAGYELRKAFDTCRAHLKAVEEAKRLYSGNMAACDAIQDLVG